MPYSAALSMRFRRETSFHPLWPSYLADAAACDLEKAAEASQHIQSSAACLPGKVDEEPSWIKPYVDQAGCAKCYAPHLLLVP